MKAPKHYPRVRIADFSNIGVQGHPVVTFLQISAEEIAKEIRKYSDLPFIFVISPDQTVLITSVLNLLKGTRSPCYPFAVYVIGEDTQLPEFPEVEVVRCAPENKASLGAEISNFAETRFVFNKHRLALKNTMPPPENVDVLIVGAGITGLYAAHRLKEKDLSFCVMDKSDIAGGIWSNYANMTSQVNTSEAAYRLVEHQNRINRDHSSTYEILEDITSLAHESKQRIYLQTVVENIERKGDAYISTVVREGKFEIITSKGVIAAINDRVGSPRKIIFPNEISYKGAVVSGFSDGATDVDWAGKRVLIIGMGAFAVENARTALEAGASYVSVVCRRHGTVCPKIIDYLNFSMPYTEQLEHDRKSNMRNMLLWKKLYELSGATEPECWMGNLKHPGHTISVSDLWFIAHHLKKMETVIGTVRAMYDEGVILNNGLRIEADVVIKCAGFSRNASAVKSLCDYSETYNNNFIDRNFMYLADAYIDDNAFNSFFGSSVLEMTKFYLDVYLYFFENPMFDEMIKIEGIEKIDIETRSWSHYINGATALIKKYPHIANAAKSQIQRRTENFMETFDLETYIEANKREWFDSHRMLAGRSMKEDECLPYVFERLAKKPR